MNRKRASFGSAALLSTVLLASALPMAATQRAKAKQGAGFTYAAHFTCGIDPPGAVQRIVPGRYATGIQIHNPNDDEITFRKRISLTFPDAAFGSAPKPGLVSKWTTNSIPAGAALMLDCGEIPSDFFPAVEFPPYIQGFLVLESKSSLDVRAVYTAAVVDGQGNATVQAMDVEVVPERVIGPGSTKGSAAGSSKN